MHPTDHVTLTPGVVETVELSVSRFKVGTVYVALPGDPAAEVWYTLDGSTPAVGAAGSYRVWPGGPPGGHVAGRGVGAATVKLLSTAAVEVSVMAGYSG